MSAEPRVYRVAPERMPLPPMTAGATCHWDGMSALVRDVGPHTGSEPDFSDRHVARSFGHSSVQPPGATGTGPPSRPFVTTGDLCLIPASPPQAIDWEREANGLTVTLDPGLLLATARFLIPGATGELVWACREARAASITLYVHPVLRIHTASESSQTDRVELVPHLHASDPLLHHMTLVLQAALDAEDVAGRVYAEALTNALAVHLLRRCETSRPPAGVGPGGLSKPKLRRTTAYIEAHLAHALSSTELAAAAQTSPAYFARLFRQSTGQTPHQYVIMCRIERAKQLLRETAWPIIEIGHHVGFTDQSYFTAVFRKHVNTTPKAFRGDT
jgi:AraC-like DNA-binding protein